MTGGYLVFCPSSWLGLRLWKDWQPGALQRTGRFAQRFVEGGGVRVEVAEEQAVRAAEKSEALIDKTAVVGMVEAAVFGEMEVVGAGLEEGSP